MAGACGGLDQEGLKNAIGTDTDDKDRIISYEIGSENEIRSEGRAEDSGCRKTSGPIASAIRVLRSVCFFLIKQKCHRQLSMEFLSAKQILLIRKSQLFTACIPAADRRALIPHGTYPAGLHRCSPWPHKIAGFLWLNGMRCKASPLPAF